MTNIILKLLDFFWSFLPKRAKVHLIQNQTNFGYLDTSKKTIQMKLESLDTLHRLHSCAKEPETIKWLDDNLKKTDVLFDVGANVGAYSLYAAAVAGSKVYSFEPSPSTFRLLLENIYANRLSSLITPFNIPLSSSSEMKVFQYSSLSSGSASHTGLESSGNTANTISQPVLTVTVDDLISKYGIPQPDLAKIDVDGHELGILNGAATVFKNTKLRSVQIELTKGDGNYNEIVRIMNTYGFKIAHVSEHPGSPSTDVVFIR